MKVGSSSGKINHVAQEVVAASAVTTATADQSMVPEAVQNTIALRAVHILVSKRDAQPSPQHRNKQRRLVVELRVFAWRGLKEDAFAMYGDEAEVNPTGGGSNIGIRKLGEGMFVSGL